MERPKRKTTNILKQQEIKMSKKNCRLHVDFIAYGIYKLDHRKKCVIFYSTNGHYVIHFLVSDRWKFSELFFRLYATNERIILFKVIFRFVFRCINIYNGQSTSLISFTVKNRVLLRTRKKRISFICKHRIYKFIARL